MPVALLSTAGKHMAFNPNGCRVQISLTASTVELQIFLRTRSPSYLPYVREHSTAKLVRRQTCIAL